MYPNDQSISSYSSNPSTPVNSPPPLTQTPIQNSTPSTSWQQPVMNNSPAPPMINGIQNGQYASSEMVHHRGIHMVIIVYTLHSFVNPSEKKYVLMCCFSTFLRPDFIHAFFFPI